MQEHVTQGTGTSKEKTTPTGPVTAGATGHSIVVETVIELIGISLMAIIADTSKAAGKLMVLLMLGFAVMWFLVNVRYFASIIGKV